MNKFPLGLAALAMAASVLATGSATAQRYDGYDGYDGRSGQYEQAYGNAYRDGYNRGPRSYRDSRRGYADRQCSSGTTGTIVGAIAGGLLGRTIDTRGDRSLGTVIGGVGGALAGRAVERSDNPGYCR